MGLATPSTLASAMTSSRNEACTVVSVMPYMLITRGEFGWSSSHVRRRCGSSASPPKTTTSSDKCRFGSAFRSSTVRNA